MRIDALSGPRVLADRACATVVDVWIGTTEIRPTLSLTTARRRQSRPRPAARNCSHEHHRRRPVNKAWSGYGRVSLRVFAHGLVVSSHARYVIFMIVYDYSKPRFIERSTFHYYFLPLLEVIAERLLATCRSRTVTPDGASHSDRRPNRAAVLSSTITAITSARSERLRSSIPFRSAYAPAGQRLPANLLRRRAGWT